MRYPTPGPHGGAPWRIRPMSNHDGDTVYALVDRGDDDDSKWSIRLKDVLAPELSEVGGPECRDFVQNWLDHNSDGTDWPFLLETFRTPRSDKDVKTITRWEGVITSADGRNLNADVQAFITAAGYGGGVGS